MATRMCFSDLVCLIMPQPGWIHPGAYFFSLAKIAARRSRHGVSVPRGQFQLVYPRSGARKHLPPLLRRIAVRQAFEGVPHHDIAVRDLVRRKVALEHAAAGAEGL